MKEYLKAKREELENNSKIKNIGGLYRGISDFKKCYQPRTNIVEKSSFVAYPYSTVARWRKHFSQLLNVNGVNDVRHTEIHTVDPLVPEPNATEIDLAIEKLKSNKPPGTDKISAELIKADLRTTRNVIHKLIVAIWNKEELPEEW
jgi:hypothetical protein